MKMIIARCYQHQAAQTERRFTNLQVGMDSINVPEYKTLHEAPHRLGELEEARDLLLRVFLKDGFCIAIFRFGAVALPEEMEPTLAGMVGEEVAILRLAGRYHVRAVGDA